MQQYPQLRHSFQQVIKFSSGAIGAGIINIDDLKPAAFKAVQISLTSGVMLPASFITGTSTEMSIGWEAAEENTEADMQLDTAF